MMIQTQTLRFVQSDLLPHGESKYKSERHCAKRYHFYSCVPATITAAFAEGIHVRTCTYCWRSGLL